MSKFNNSIVPNKVCIGWHFSSNKYSYRDAYLALEYLVMEIVNISNLFNLIVKNGLISRHCLQLCSLKMAPVAG